MLLYLLSAFYFPNVKLHGSASNTLYNIRARVSGGELPVCSYRSARKEPCLKCCV